MAKEKQKSAARDMFINTDTPQYEIAEIVGVNPATISKWAADGKWEELKGANSLTRDEVIGSLYLGVQKLTGTHGELVANNADKICKLAAAIDRLQPSKTSLHTKMQVLRDFNNWMLDTDLEAAKSFAKFQKRYINEQVNPKPFNDEN